ncbi:uncharacterized protein LOC142165300 [Nicotiana tabacum]|uniref:Uncharacterized protein LOC142165300 n=1 Tax=Nicotiana tabacum TaxID=4097 RepID=A0AC58S4R8_TOBAC
MQQVSTSCTVGTPTGRIVVFGPIPKAIHEMGVGYSWNVVASSREGPYKIIGEMIDFLWENIICWFRIPKEIACDNGLQFIGSKVTKFLEALKIKKNHIFTSPSEHKWTGKSTNKVIIQNKKRLEAAKDKWPKELPRVLWTYRMTAKSSTRETPFFLVYSTEALIPMEIGEPTLRYLQADEEASNEALLVKLEQLDEQRDLAYIRMVTQKQRMERYYNGRANLHYFKSGGLGFKDSDSKH